MGGGDGLPLTRYVLVLVVVEEVVLGVLDLPWMAWAEGAVGG